MNVLYLKTIEAGQLDQAVENFFNFQTKYDNYLRKKAIDRMVFYMTGTSILEKQEKFLAGRAANGGEFDPRRIALELEIEGEATDGHNYSDLKSYVEYLDDPSGFEEMVSQHEQ